MNKFICVINITILLLLTGCGVSPFKPQNWQPNDVYASKKLYTCLQQSQQIESSAFFGANQSVATGSSNTSANTNKNLLTSCMNANGYNLRPMTQKEAIIGLLSFPLIFPLAIVFNDDLNSW